MPVLRQVPRGEITDKTILAYFQHLFGDRDPTVDPGTATGTPGDWWSVFALAPDIFRHAVDGFAVYRHPARRISPVLRELGQTRAGWVKGSDITQPLNHGGSASKAVWQLDEAIDQRRRHARRNDVHRHGSRGLGR